MSRDYQPGVRYRAIVSVWRDLRDSEDRYAGADRGAERVVCVEVEGCRVPEWDKERYRAQRDQARTMAIAAMRLLYPEADQVDCYNLVDEFESPAEVLGYVTGGAHSCQCYEEHPIVLFRQEHDPAKYREPTAITWAKAHALSAAKMKGARP